MKLHANAKLTPRTRLELVRSVESGSKTVSQAARDLGVSQMTAFKWLARYRAEGEAGLADRSSRPAKLRAATPARVVKRIERLRRQRLTMARIALQTGVSTSTVERILKRAGMSRLKNLDPEEPVIRYERASPGELIHIDTKKLGCIGRVGHRITGDRTSRVRGIGWETVFIAIDDHSRLAFAEVTDGLESRETASAFLSRALAYFAKLGVRVSQVMTDNAKVFGSHAFQAVLENSAIRHLRIRPYTPRTNGKAERFIQSALREWAYGFAYRSSAQRTKLLDRWLHHYNWHRPHGGIGALPPISRLDLPISNLLALHS